MQRLLIPLTLMVTLLGGGSEAWAACAPSAIKGTWLSVDSADPKQICTWKVKATGAFTGECNRYKNQSIVDQKYVVGELLLADDCKITGSVGIKGDGFQLPISARADQNVNIILGVFEKYGGFSASRD